MLGNPQVFVLNRLNSKPPESEHTGSQRITARVRDLTTQVEQTGPGQWLPKMSAVLKNAALTDVERHAADRVLMVSCRNLFGTETFRRPGDMMDIGLDR